MNDTLQAILDYMQTPQTDYALLITGPWGCGKTYFWRNVVEPKLRQVKSDGDSWRPLYASLYGCRSTKDIDTQLFLASCPRLRNKWTARLAQVGGGIVNQCLSVFTRFELPAVDLRWLINTKNAVLCFDDLERTQLPMKEALGYINTFVEHELVKTIILCNEEAITSEEDKKTYAAMKEKVLGVSLTFRPDLDTVFSTLIEEHKPRMGFHRFISQNAKLLRHLFDKSETHNIRALRRAMEALAFIFEALRADKVDPSAAARQLIYAIAPASFELHGRGADPANLRKILGMEHMFAARIALADRGRERSEEEKYKAEFADKYLSYLGWADWRDAVGCPPICEFLLTGFLDRPALVSWAQELTKPPDEREERIKRLMYGPRDLEDGEFARTTTQVLEEVESGEIAAAGRYVVLYDMFEWFADGGLIALRRQEVLAKFTGGLSKAQRTGKLQPEPDLKDNLAHSSGVPRTDEGRILRERVLEANNSILECADREYVRGLASRLQDDPERFVHALSDEGESGLLLMPVFQDLRGDETAARIISLPNHLKARFTRAIRARYEERVPLLAFVDELPVLRQIREILNAHCGVSPKSKEPVPMSRFVIHELVEAIDGAIERLSQHDKHRETPASTPIEQEDGT